MHLHHSGWFTERGNVTCNFHIPFLRQDDSVGDQLLDTQNVISRFRANLVIAGVEPFEEDNWSRLIIGNTRFVVSWHLEINDKVFQCIESGFLKNECAPCVINPKVTGQCGRCHIVGVDQDSGTKTKEPLMSLSACRSGKVSSNQPLPAHADSTCVVAVMSEWGAWPWKDKSLCLLFCTFLGDFRCVPGPSATRGLHCSKCPLCWLHHTARTTQFLKKYPLFISVNAFFDLSDHCCTAGPKDQLSAVWSFSRGYPFFCVCSPDGFCPLRTHVLFRTFRFYSIQVCLDAKCPNGCNLEMCAIKYLFHKRQRFYTAASNLKLFAPYNWNNLPVAQCSICWDMGSAMKTSMESG